MTDAARTDSEGRLAVVVVGGVLGALVVVTAGFFTGGVGSEVRHALVGAAFVVAAASCAVAALRAAAGPVRLGWGALGVAAVSWSVAFTAGDGHGTTVTGAALRGLALVSLAVGLAVSPGVRRSGSQWGLLLLDGWLVGSTCFLLAWLLVLQPAGATVEQCLRDLPMIVWSILSLLVLSVLIGLVRRTSRHEQLPLFLVLAAAGLLSFADGTLFSSDTRAERTASDAGWLVAALLLAAVPLAGRLDVFATATPVLREHQSFPRRALALVGAVTVVGIATTAAGRPVDLVTGLVSAGLVVAVLAQLGLLLHENTLLYRAAAAQAAELEAFVQGSSDVLIACDLEGAVRYASPAVERVFGHEARGLEGVPVVQLIDEDHVEEVVAGLRRVRQDGGTVRLQFRVRHPDGGWRHAEATVSLLHEHGEVAGHILTLRDVSDRVALEDELAHRATHDALTGLPNRLWFRERVAAALAARRGVRGLGVLFLDLDDFKAVNDAAGHEAGDALLVETARRLQHALRDEDCVARFGGDEFAALVHGGDRAGVVSAASRVRASLAGPYAVAGREAVVHVSIGVAFATEDATVEELLRNADLAMYRAKAGGKDRVEVFAGHMHTEAVRRARLAADLRDAVERGELYLDYQPIVDLRDGAVSRAEALLRWRRSPTMLLGPSEFVPIAEESGLIVPVGRWVLTEALRQAQRWRAAGLDIGVSVNLSARQLSDSGLVEDVRQALEVTGAPPQSLTLEITENMLMSDMDLARERLTLLRRTGVTVALDDFGTGFSSLRYLHSLPVDVLKVDRSFVSGIGVNEGNTVLSATIVNLGRDLGLSTVAEGVETPEQLAWLRASGCPRAQGFLLARPMPGDEVVHVARAGLGAVVLAIGDGPPPDDGKVRRAGGSSPHDETVVPPR